MFFSSFREEKRRGNEYLHKIALEPFIHLQIAERTITVHIRVIRVQILSLSAVIHDVSICVNPRHPRSPKEVSALKK